MKMWKKSLKYLIASLTILTTACWSPNQVSLFNLSNLYRETESLKRPRSEIFHLSDTVSALYVEVDLADLMYKRPDENSDFEAWYKITYTLTSGYEFKDVLDSLQLIFRDSENFGRNSQQLHRFEIKALRGKNYLLTLTLTDINRGEQVMDYISVYKKEPVMRQDFLLMGSNDELLFRNYVNSDERFKIIVNDAEITQLGVRAYFRDYPVARPPFMMDEDPSFDYHADSIFYIPVERKETPFMIFEKEGIYHFVRDTGDFYGATVFRFHQGFPEIYRSSQMIPPLRYITTKKEYEEIINAPDKKAAMDEFWLTTAGNQGRARTLIQKYYGNVQKANIFFTSYMEGWKTDRGLIYTIYGPPTVMYRGNEMEEWIYGEPQNRNSLRFTFQYVLNPFSDNDLSLIRSPDMKEPWYMTVQGWRR